MKRIRSALVAWSSVAFLTAASAQPAVTPDLPLMNLDDLGVYAVGYAYRGQPDQQFPLGWSGLFEDRTGVACEPFGTQHGERAFLLHCPWRNGTGITFQQFVFDLPARVTRVLLRGATAMRSENAAKLDSVDAWNHVQVRYENGLIVTANAGPNTFPTGKWLLPDLGWVAQGAGVTAGTTLRDGVVTDFSDSGDTLFLNARSAADWNLSSYRHVRPSVAAFEQTGTRVFRVTYRWDVQDLLAKDYACFVHFCADGVICAQQDHSVSPPTSHWQANRAISDGSWSVTLPGGLSDGDYDWLIGLFDAVGDGARVPLQGLDDGTRRIRLGVLHLTKAGTLLTFTAETNSPAFDPAAWHGQHLNNANRVVDFGDARTDGSAWLHREGNVWLLKTWPRERNFTLEFNQARFGQPARVQCIGGGAPEVAPVQIGLRWGLPLNGASEYHWIIQEARSRRP